MLFSLFIVLTGLMSAVNGHFRLNFPAPRGVFVADQEPNFCGGYNNAVSNRTVFPLSGGFFTIRSGHPSWTVGVLISTVQNPTSFDNFSVNGQPQLVRPYAKQENPGTFCIPLNISDANIPDAKDGANVTIQVVFQGGDGNLYQCADLTLSSTATIPSNITCGNQTTTATQSSSAPSSSQTARSLGRKDITACHAAIFLGFIGVTLALLY